MVKKVIPENVEIKGWKDCENFKNFILDSVPRFGYSKIRARDLANLRTASLFKDNIRYITSDRLAIKRNVSTFFSELTDVDTDFYKFDNYINVMGFLKNSKYKFYLKDVNYVNNKWEVECIVQDNKSGNREYLINKIIDN